MTKGGTFSTDFHKKTLLISVQSPYNRTGDIKSYFNEFENLASTYGVIDIINLPIKLRTVEAAHFFTKGKLSEIKEVFDAHDFDEILISDALSGQQERNLNAMFNCPILDRTRLIIAIFEKSAITAEGKIQVEIAKLEFGKTRLTGRGVELDQQAGCIGIRSGPGETIKEATLRYLNLNIKNLKGQLEKLEKSKNAQRKKRLNNETVQICLVGYTNAGKSTILNALTHSNVLAKDQLFATLDTTTRQLFINARKIGVLSDTVGFIQQLPHQLIESFKSTLAELSYASLLLVVIDISDNNWRSHIDVVLQTLDEIKIDKEMLFVFNKKDLINKKELQARLQSFDLDFPSVAISCNTANGLAPLKKHLAEWKPKTSKSST